MIERERNKGEEERGRREIDSRERLRVEEKEERG